MHIVRACSQRIRAPTVALSQQPSSTMASRLVHSPAFAPAALASRSSLLASTSSSPLSASSPSRASRRHLSDGSYIAKPLIPTARRLHQAPTEAVEIIDAFPAIPTKLMITCEHASMRLPAPWKWTEADHRLLGAHWSFDAGAEDFTRELVSRLPAVGILARFSRLLCDANRPLGSDSMFRDNADGLPVELNNPATLTEAEILRRVDLLYRPYHAALKLVHSELKPTTVISAHSFTPVYEGQKRTVEIGVLYNLEKDRPLAEKFQAAFQSLGIVTALNEPWSAKSGFMYAADQFSAPHTSIIMFEFRQDLVVQQGWRQKVVQQTEEVLRAIGH